MWFLVELDPPRNLVMLKEEPRTPPQPQVVKICFFFLLSLPEVGPPWFAASPGIISCSSR